MSTNIPVSIKYKVNNITNARLLVNDLISKFVNTIDVMYSVGEGNKNPKQLIVNNDIKKYSAKALFDCSTKKYKCEINNNTEQTKNTLVFLTKENQIKNTTFVNFKKYGTFPSISVIVNNDNKKLSLFVKNFTQTFFNTIKNFSLNYYNYLQKSNYNPLIDVLIKQQILISEQHNHTYNITSQINSISMTSHIFNQLQQQSYSLLADIKIQQKNLPEFNININSFKEIEEIQLNLEENTYIINRDINLSINTKQTKVKQPQIKANIESVKTYLSAYYSDKERIKNILPTKKMSIKKGINVIAYPYLTIMGEEATAYNFVKYIDMFIGHDYELVSYLSKPEGDEELSFVVSENFKTSIDSKNNFTINKLDENGEAVIEPFILFALKDFELDLRKMA